MEPIIQVKNVSFEVDKQMILKDVSFDIQKGERVTITGPSGGGKSTLLKIIASILTPTGGTVSYQNKDIQEMDPLDYRKDVSYFFQNATLFDETVEDNLTFPFDIKDEEFDKEKCLRMLARVKLDETYLKKPIKELSGGEKQRVSIVRNLLFRPQVLLLDEITSSLDAENKDIIYAILDELTNEEAITILFVTHDAREIEMSHRVITIHKGEVENTQ
ncbi:ATP-binding cassette domain-containing protein [Alkalibacterium iburiense]|uniref:ATP-binding cassette domain-containing protein n=1 Tax=Alkalibacterium iburiense TaxID=290589 RepID=A0ABN0X650_9LACT